MAWAFFTRPSIGFIGQGVWIVATKRKAISKRTRFEVFKRDKFTCQYCGGRAPDIVLVIDHITPVASGGGNELLNLVTSCESCNQGKSDKHLSDGSAINKQLGQLEQIQERRNQLALLKQWRDECNKLNDELVAVVNSELSRCFNKSLTDTGVVVVRKMLQKYSIHELIGAIETVFERYGADCEKPLLETAESVLRAKALEAKNPGSSRAAYAAGILKRRFPQDYDGKRFWMAVNRAMENDIDVEVLVKWSKEERYFYNFVRNVKEFNEQCEG